MTMCISLMRRVSVACKVCNLSRLSILFCAWHVGIFAEREERYWNLRTNMISTRGHPSFEGYRKWEQAVIEKAKTILQGGSP